jgi:hypothetical protein
MAQSRKSLRKHRESVPFFFKTSCHREVTTDNQGIIFEEIEILCPFQIHH